MKKNDHSVETYRAGRRLKPYGTDQIQVSAWAVPSPMLSVIFSAGRLITIPESTLTTTLTLR